MFIPLLILTLGISPAFIYWWFRRRIETRVMGQLSTRGTGVAVTHWRRPNLPPDAEYVEGVGYLIGDITCQYNARSSYIRCAVNPSGPCQDCRFYQAKSIGGDE
ncbi:DUF6464 family protein [Limnoraphis robusta Tam1]|uniref:DUF6464 family protein n=1 Tax=Limnoraphis robusta CCNP1315 TaxID=3110306 RepID=A0ABU5U152_9CYAN|nr:DUF6464 family protein [Limnoraphis robusta]MEA5496681.1 DUF6464 family protein [Limnoraphis robusta BA-68 BA1]MEA5520795.1 DUF6464 family protein [Limnoraphis robusta CCNP1315]MEA5541642.1 DUF6464 family protein [Limnoraphis robusta Tam1]MEA5544442.1 DUF6464 family protein [Limnoraphis robusta CCNP1324]